MKKIISVELFSDFGFFKKPDTNNSVNFSYNMLPKPTLLGILGAIVGLEGYKEKNKPPEYYKVLKDLEVGLKPLNHQNGSFQKTTIKYNNTVGYANKTESGTLNIEEAILIKPAYLIYLLLDLENKHHNKLLDFLQNGKAEYVPYFGKNEHSCWWDKDSFREYEFERVEKLESSIRITTLFQMKGEDPPAVDLKQTESARRRDRNLGSPFIFFERLPHQFDEQLFQYELEKYVFSNYLFQKDISVKNLTKLSDGKFIQLN
jgi:CRISPR-associated protein Cas5h